MRDFNKWLGKFKISISDYSYYVDFPKVYQNINEVKVELNILNSLVGSKNIEAEFEALVTRYPETLKCIPLLLAVRNNEIPVKDEGNDYLYSFHNKDDSLEQYKIFMRKTGLFELMEKQLTANLVDYVTGVEVGLDSNARKNRGGVLMENLVETYLRKSGVEYYKEKTTTEIENKWGVNLSKLTNRGKAIKKFDFVVKSPSFVYGIETNFYASGASKLNETARSYETIALEAKQIDGFKFIWFTDGRGWQSARNNLEKTFVAMEHIYSIADLEGGIMERIFV
jgi:type II restriction enzyme